MNNGSLTDYAHGEMQVQQGGRVRHSVPARVDLRSGALFVDAGLSRDAYDWGLDDIVFRVRGSQDTVPVEEGTEFEGEGEVEFCVNPCELPDIKRAWAAYQQGGTSPPSSGRRIR